MLGAAGDAGGERFEVAFAARPRGRGVLGGVVKQRREERPDAIWDVWRDGDQLVRGADAHLPDRCVKSDAPAEGHSAEIGALWHEPAVCWLPLLNVLVYLIVARAVGARVVVEGGIIPEALSSSRRGGC